MTLPTVLQALTPAQWDRLRRRRMAASETFEALTPERQARILEIAEQMARDRQRPGLTK